ncbi:MAG: S1 RNA-binding domain-containing protein [Bacteroidia bacterium]
MIQLGVINSLKVIRQTDNGFYLEDEDQNEVLLPNAYIEGISLDDTVDVFIYADSEDRLVATTLRPTIMLNEIALLEVRNVTFVGAFLDWGLPKDLFVPFNEQQEKMQEGKRYAVILLEDKATRRLIGSSKIKKYIKNENINYKPGDEVSLIVLNQSDLGVNVLINRKHIGLVYQDDIYVILKQNDELKGYIKRLREDNKIDVSLRPFGYRKVKDSTEVILDELKAQGGVLNLGDKSSPDEIIALLKMSKKNFKKAIGALYKSRLITIEDNRIRLIK